MDNFFDYGEATNNSLNRREQPARNQDLGTLNPNLMRADFPNDETSFLSLQHFVDGLTSSSNSPEYIQATNTPERGAGRSDDFNDLSRWIDGARLPARPCDYCQSKGLQCLIIQRNSAQVMSCTSCHALSRSCSLVQDQGLSNRAEGSESFDSTAAGAPSRSASNLRRPQAPNEPVESNEGESGTSKVGARFPRESVRVLKQWLTVHHQHPYPTDAEKEELKRQTGLNKTQITNWLANARRRGKVRAPGTLSPSSSSHALDIPARTTPVSEPLERWKNSPPESEPASVSAIATAVRTTSLRSTAGSPYRRIRTDETSSHTRASSASSLNTSHSSGHSFASAISRQGSFGTFGKRGRRRRRRQAPKPNEAYLNSGPRQFQCTFCTESFRTKHDWQRHEKSLHLSLERWVCSADGGTCVCRENRHIACVFCGLPRPSASHLETHNYSSCLEHDLEERTFYRKDHLRQHLRLVHGCKFNAWSMESWRATIPEVKSTCGFCGVRMTTWQKRADHLAEHFKSGKSMVDWRGDWGFESHIAAIVESAVLPKRTHQAQSTVLRSPQDATSRIGLPSPSSYELVKIGLIEYIHAKAALGHVPSNTELQYESVRLVFGVPSSPNLPSEIRQSWFHDLILFSDNSSWLEPFKGFTSQALGSQDELEIQLLEYVRTQRALGIQPSTADLQAEACRIITNTEAASTIPSEAAASWFRHLAKASHIWLHKFRVRAGLPHRIDSNNSMYSFAPTTDTNLTSSKLESQLAEYVNMQVSLGVLPTDPELQAMARWIVFSSNDPRNQTVADTEEWLQRFKLQHGYSTQMPNFVNSWPVSYPATSQSLSPSTPISPWQRQSPAFNSAVIPVTTASSYLQSPSITNFGPSFRAQDQPIRGDLEQALSNYVRTATSPTNPNRYLPSDDDLRTQARWIIYNNSDDPYNQPTPADNPEWLNHFKRSQSQANREEIRDLNPQATSTSLAPTFSRTVSASNTHGRGRGESGLSQNNSTSFPASQTQTQGQANIFGAPELEAALTEYVKNSLAQGYKPSNEELRRAAKTVMGGGRTAADDDVLLGLFRARWGIGGGEA